MNYMVIDKVETYFKIMKHFIERLKKYCVATETVFCDNCVHCNNLLCKKTLYMKKIIIEVKNTMSYVKQ